MHDFDNGRKCIKRPTWYFFDSSWQESKSIIKNIHTRPSDFRFPFIAAKANNWGMPRNAIGEKSKQLTSIAQSVPVMNDAAELNFDESQPKVGYLINRARTKLKEAIDRELSQFDITAAQFVVLSMLAANSPESAAQLCRENSYDPGAMTRMIDRLEKKNFLRRVRNPADRRVVSLELTEQGRAIHPKLRLCSLNVASRLLRGFSQKEVEQFENLLERLLKNS